MTSAPPLDIRGLSCRYGDRLALDEASLILESGEILGITGLPGSGTSTLIKAILLLVAPQGGRVLVFDKPHELASSRERLAYLPEALGPPGHLTGRDIIAMTRTSRRQAVDPRNIARLAGDLHLAPELLAQPVRRYSRGDVQKLGLVTVLAADRPILLLDQPMSHLEPEARAGLCRRLKDHARRGGAVLIGSHRLDEIRRIVDRLGILRDGRLDDVRPAKIVLRTNGLEASLSAETAGRRAAASNAGRRRRSIEPVADSSLRPHAQSSQDNVVRGCRGRRGVGNDFGR